MSDQHSATPETPATPAPQRRRGRSWLFVTTIALAAGLTGAVASRAISQQYWHGPGFMGGTFDPARIEDGADRGVRHLAIEIDATNEQQEKLRAIVKGAIKDLLPMREKALSARQRGRVLLTQPSIDKAAIEALRDRADGACRRRQQALRAGPRRCRRGADARATPQDRRPPDRDARAQRLLAWLAARLVCQGERPHSADRRRHPPCRDGARLSWRGGVRCRARRDRRGRPRHAGAQSIRCHCPRPDAARHGRPRCVPPAPVARERADPDADGAGRRHGPRHRPRVGGRRLSAEALRAARAACPPQGGPEAWTRSSQG